ncbi:MAG: hypothetical protein EXR48_06145 [Dehalococcoidia bacterium]|nr:hypothetical protein [Dehalococcoidia bacterium]
MDGRFYFSTDSASCKGRNLAANPNAVMHLESGDDVAVVEGRAEEVMERGVLRRFAAAYKKKYDFLPDVNSASSRVYCLRPQAVFAWEERDFPSSATRWAFR